MSESRPSLAPSMSFSGSSSASALTRPLKRRLTATQDLNFFTPSAASFNPLPYALTSTTTTRNSQTSNPSGSARSHLRSVEALAIPPPGKMPLHSDPNIILIHPPFTVFPGSDNYSDGLSYTLMEKNPNWFLDPNDFISAKSTNPHAISYPPQLEPPRGWCPAKKKDLKERGSEGWPEGEEPRLRCTFCRSTYAGVNAKSMWRRHVFEKHKIAMANRRDPTERHRGRSSSNKENRPSHTNKSRGDTHESVFDVDLAPQDYSDTTNTSHTLKFRPIASAGHKRSRSPDIDSSISSALQSRQEEFIAPNRRHPLSQSSLPSSPPLIPEPQYCPTLDITANLQIPSRTSSPSPLPLPVLTPASPYDPLLTPSFRHSPPRLPSDQPWRFPSPSHPLHSKQRELCLSMLAREYGSPVSTCTPGHPSSLRASQVTPLRSPLVRSTGHTYTNVLETPVNLIRSNWLSPQNMFSGKRSKFLAAGRLRPERMQHQVEESPLSRSRDKGFCQGTGGENTYSWPTTPLPTFKSLDLEAVPTDHDPFIANTYSSLGPFDHRNMPTPSERCTPPLSSPEVDSPVVRRTALSSSNAHRLPLVGLGVGLMKPFRLSGNDSSSLTDDSDFSGEHIPSPLLEDGDGAESISIPDISATPPLKRRKTIDSEANSQV